MARLYANENFPFPAVIELRRLGHDVLTTYEAGKNRQFGADQEARFRVMERMGRYGETTPEDEIAEDIDRAIAAVRAG